jgi:LPXTG-motif cell wall-anchored protein
MNKKFVTLLSVAILSSATTTFADTLSLGGDSTVTNDTTSIVVTSPTETKPTEEKPKEDKSSTVVIGGESEKPIDDKTGGIIVTPTKKEKPSEAPAGTPAPKVNDNLDLGGDSEKQQEKDNKGIVVDSPTPSDQSKEEKTAEDTPEIKEQKQKAEEIVGVKEKDTPQPLNVTKEEIKETPIETNTGHKVVSTNQGKVVIETDEGNYVEKEPYEVGAVKQKDGTIALKDKEGQLKVLPNTGTASTIFVTIWGLIGLIATVYGRIKIK